MFETSLPDEIILKICHYLSWFDVINAFYNLNSRLNRTIHEYLIYATIGNDCCLKRFRYECSFLLHHQLSLFSFIRSLTISNRGSPLAAKYFLFNITIQNMIYLEKPTLIQSIGKDILSYLDIIDQAGENMFQYFTTLHINDPQYINGGLYAMQYTSEEQTNYESTIINRILTGNNSRLKSIIMNGDDIYM